MLERTLLCISELDECILSLLGLGGVKGLIKKSTLGMVYQWNSLELVLRSVCIMDISE